MPDSEEQEKTEESAAEESRPLAVTHGNQVCGTLVYFSGKYKCTLWAI